MTNSRQKGKAGERSLAKELRELGFVNARRGVQYNGADGSADVEGMSDLIHIECKVTEVGHGKLYEWLEQSKGDARVNEMPVVMHKQQSKKSRGKNWLVTVELKDFAELWRKAHGE